jgi:hypothetical protein
LKKLLLLVIPLLLLLGWLYARGQGPAEVPFTKAVRETLVSTLNTNGKVEPIEWAPAHAAIGGPVKQIHVQRGRRCARASFWLRFQYLKRRSDIGTAQARINAARAEIDALNQGGRASEQAEIESGLVAEDRAFCGATGTRHAGASGRTKRRYEGRGGSSPAIGTACRAADCEPPAAEERACDAAGSSGGSGSSARSAERRKRRDAAHSDGSNTESD